MSGGASYLRCTHCRGFYEASFDACKWCEYDAPLLDPAGRPRVFPDRETCRAIQVAEFEQLPAEAIEDYMAPPRDEPGLLCNCLHCGPRGHVFEAIEMRWIANERMWACPCTTCGGRGFQVDIHSAEHKWQCAGCGHFYTPADGDYSGDNAKCPKCGCTEANGWFDDGDDGEDEGDGEWDRSVDEKAASAGELTDEELPWDDDDLPAGMPGGAEYDLGITWRESDDEEEFGDDLPEGEGRMPDDIDFPRNFDHDRGDTGFRDDDIPF